MVIGHQIQSHSCSHLQLSDLRLIWYDHFCRFVAYFIPPQRAISCKMARILILTSPLIFGMGVYWQSIPHNPIKKFYFSPPTQFWGVRWGQMGSDGVKNENGQTITYYISKWPPQWVHEEYINRKCQNPFFHHKNGRFLHKMAKNRGFGIYEVQFLSHALKCAHNKYPQYVQYTFIINPGNFHVIYIQID